MITFEELHKLWIPHKDLKLPPTEPIELCLDGGRGVWITSEWGPAVPYPSVQHWNGNVNHGYQRLKGNLGAIGAVPEVQGWPEFVRFLETINAESSPIESVGCEKTFFTNNVLGQLPVRLGSYVDIIFSEPTLNDRPENIFHLIVHLARSIEGCEKWGAIVEFEIQRLKILEGSETPWGLMLRVVNGGRNEAEARKFWAVTLSRMGNAIASLAPDFPRESSSTR